MNKIMNFFLGLVFLTNIVQSNENGDKKIDFLLNECTLKIPSNYDIAISSDLDIRFVKSIRAILKESTESTFEPSVQFSLNLTDTNASKIVFDDLNKTQPNGIKRIIKKDNLLLIEFIDGDDMYLIGRSFYLHTSEKDANHTKVLIESCLKTWNEDMFIENLDTLSDKIIKDFLYTPPIALDKERALKIQKKLESIYENSLK